MKHSKSLAAALAVISALAAGKTIEYTSQTTGELVRITRDGVTTSPKADTDNKQAPLPEAVNTSHFLATLGFGRLAKELRRKEPIWIGYKRPENYAKQARRSGKWRVAA